MDDEQHTYSFELSYSDSFKGSDQLEQLFDSIGETEDPQKAIDEEIQPLVEELLGQSDLSWTDYGFMALIMGALEEITCTGFGTFQEDFGSEAVGIRVHHYKRQLSVADLTNQTKAKLKPLVKKGSKVSKKDLEEVYDSLVLAHSVAMDNGY